MKVDGSVAIISIKNFPVGLHVMYLYFPDTPRICQAFQRLNIREKCAFMVTE